MIAARPAPGLTVRPCQARAPPRLWTVRVQASQQRSPTTQRSEPLAPQLLAALETAALVLAVGGHAVALLAAQRQAAAITQPALQQQQQQQQDQQQRRSSHVRLALVQAADPLPPAAALAVPGGAWLTLPLLAALVLGRLRSWLARGSSPVPRGAQRGPGQEAAARLLRVEAAASQQAAQLEALARQLDKLSLRSRLVGRDLKLPLKQLQLAAGQQAGALVGVAQRMERMEKDIRDTEELVGAMQGLSAKQFQLLLKVLEQQQAVAKQQQAGPLQQQQQQAAAKQAGPLQQQQQQGADASAGAGAASGTRPARGDPVRAGAGRGSISGTLGAAPWPHGAGACKPQEGAGLAAGAEAAVDEWGRRVVALSQQQQQAPPLPPVPNSVAASALSSGGDGPPPPLPDSGPPGPHAGAAPDSFATGATLPEGLLAGLEALRAAQRGSGVGGAGLSTQALLDILDSDPRFRAERSMISALLNQPKKVERPGVEILPPLGPRPPLPLDEDEQEEQQRLVQEWRERVARAWTMPPPEGAALGGAAEAGDASSSGPSACQDSGEGAAAQHDGPASSAHGHGGDDGCSAPGSDSCASGSDACDGGADCD